MRRIALMFAASTLAITPSPLASAADMPARIATKAPVALPAPSWTGFYVGAHGGGAWADSDWGYSNSQPYSATGPGIPPTALRNSFDPSGWVAGGQAGYNYQIGQWVLGVELTGSATGLKQTVANVIQYPPVAAVFVGTEVESLFTATGRAGFLAAPQLLLYVKGGYAGGNVRTTGNIVPPFAGTVLNFATSEWHNGWTLGVGTEYRVTRNITLGAGYDFIDLTRKDHTGNIFITPGNPANAVIHPVQVDVHAITGRVNYLFGQN